MKQKDNKKMMILSAIAIIIVVLGHTGCTVDLMNTIFKFGSFHMALFIFISGYFYTEKNEKILGKNGYIIKQIQKMIIPYIIWNLIYGILGMILRKIGIINFGDDINFKSFFIKPWIHRSSIYI